MFPLVDSEHITIRRNAINYHWENLKKLTDARTKVLTTAKEIHTFNREADDMVHQITVSYVRHVHTCIGETHSKEIHSKKIHSKAHRETHS